MKDKVLIMVPYDSVEEFEDRHRKLLKEVVKELFPDIPNKHSSEIYGTRQEVSQAIHVSLPTLNSLTKSADLKGYRIGGRVLYKWTEVDAALTKIETLKYRRTQ